MQTINNRMTETQIADLFSLAVQLQVKAEESDDRDTAILAYSIQNACSNLTESQREFRASGATIHNLELKLTDMAVQLANAESKCRELAAENAYLLNGASRELNTSWMFHKTMLGAQAALVCLTHGYQAAAREWLEGTTDEAGAEIPDDISVGELHEWFESNMVSNGGNSGFLTRKEAEVAIRKECPATDAFLAGVRVCTLDEFAKAQDEQAKKYYEISPGCSGQNECQFAAGQALYYAECLRKGAAQLATDSTCCAHAKLLGATRHSTATTATDIAQISTELTCIPSKRHNAAGS